MPLKIQFSLLLTAALLLGGATLIVRLAKVAKLYPGPANGADLFARLLVQRNDALAEPLVAAIAWMFVSVSVMFILPLIAGQGSFALYPIQLGVALENLVFAPILVGSYVFLVRSIHHFDHEVPEEKRSIPTQTKAVLFWGYQLLLLALALVIQAKAAGSEVDMPIPCSPWVDLPGAAGANASSLHLAWPCIGTAPTKALDLSWIGAAYFSLRGVEAFLALALVGTVLAVWFTLSERFDGVCLVDHYYPGLGPKLRRATSGWRC